MIELTEQQKRTLEANKHIPTETVLQGIVDTQKEIREQMIHIEERTRFIINLEKLIYIRILQAGVEI